MALIGDPRRAFTQLDDPATTGTLNPQPPTMPTTPLATPNPSQPSTRTLPISQFTSPTTGKEFIRPAPTGTTYGDFVAPNPADVANDPAYQFRLAEGQKAQERSAAAHGTLLTGGFQKALQRYSQGLASDEANNAFQRALSTYGTNRDTAAQNFGQQHTSFGDDLAAYEANLRGVQTYANLPGAQPSGSGGTPSSSAASSDIYGALPGSTYATSGSAAPDVSFADIVAATRAQNEAENARLRLPQARTPTPWTSPVQRGALA